MRQSLSLSLGAGGDAQTPLTIFGLASVAIWVDSLRGVTLSGSNVSAWADQSGNARHFTQGTGSLQPLHEADGMGAGRPSIHFNSDYMTTPAFTLAQPCHIFAVVRQVAWTAGRYFWDASPINRLLAYQNTITPNIRIFSGVLGPQLAGPTIGSNGYFETEFNGASSAIRVNGSAPTSGDAGSNGTTGGFAMGDFYGGAGAGAPANFKIRSFFAVNRAITAAERTAVNFYLASLV